MAHLKAAFRRLRSLGFIEVEPGKPQPVTLPVEKVVTEEFDAWHSLGNDFASWPPIARRIAELS